MRAPAEPGIRGTSKTVGGKALPRSVLDCTRDGRLRLLQPAELGAEHREHLGRGRRRNGGVAAAPADDRRLAEEVTGGDLSNDVVTKPDRAAAVDEDEERVAGRTLPDEFHALADLARLEPRRDLLELWFR